MTMIKNSDTFTSLLDDLSNTGLEVYAKFMVADPKYTYEEPKELTRRRDNQKELLDHLEGKAFKLGPKGQDILKVLVSKPLPSYANAQNASVGGNWVYADLQKLFDSVKKQKDDVKLKDVEALKSICQVKDESLTVGQFKHSLGECKKDFENRSKELQMILHIADDDLSPKNLRRFLKNIEDEAAEKAHVYKVGEERDIGDIKLPKITHKDLSFIDSDDMPETISDMVREIMALSSGGVADDDDNVHNFRRNAPNNAKEAIQIFAAMKRLFPGLSYEVLLDEANPQSTAVEVSRVQEAFINALDKITHHAWEEKISLVLIRSMRQVVLLSVKGHEQTIVQQAVERFVEWKEKLIEARI